MHPDDKHISVCKYCHGTGTWAYDEYECKHCRHMREEEYYWQKDDKKDYRRKEISRQEAAMRQAAIARREAENRKKEARVKEGIVKVCSECEREMPHDPNDYICIVCRDGADAMPSKDWPQAA